MNNAYACNIVIDLEFTPIPKRMWQKALRNEIIEIGAVKVGADGSVLDEFSRLVKPEFASGVAGKVHWLTGIGDEDLTCARPLAEVLKEFSGWVGSGRARMVTWSPADKRQMDCECAVKGIEAGLPVRWLDIQRLYPRLMGTRKRAVALEEAANWCGIEHDRGLAHRALYDAQITAEIFRMMADGECAAQRDAIDEGLKKGPVTSVCASIGECCGGLADLFAALVAQEAAAA
ncbi:MAG: exonuclease domain-containing protein [Atopobiaceae bacterium]|nr:exonuclease domain-containing protein [Atopobiaceae bacterium]